MDIKTGENFIALLRLFTNDQFFATVSDFAD
jgi:hypothetical protein